MQPNMWTYPRSVLPPHVSTKLALLGARLEYGPTDPELADVLAGLSALSPNLIVRASREIAATAHLGWWRPRKLFWFQRLFRKSYSVKDLLKKNPDYGWLFIFHYDGYVREVALNAIAKPPTSPFFLAALAWRLNDWVEPVRDAAKRCARRVLHLTDTDTAVTGSLYLLDRRLVWGRWTDELEVLDDFYARKDIMAGLAEQFRTRPNGPLATCLRHALRYPNIDEHLPDLAFNAVQPAVRAVAYECLIAGKAAWPAGYDWLWIDKVYNLRRRVLKLDSRDVEPMLQLAELIQRGMRDKSIKVRIVAADALVNVRAQLADADYLIEQLARDPSAAVRLRADYMLRHPATSRA